ncbi:MAG: cyclomaltodextrinase [Clostridiaceae bacterium]|nr:cyclomaltodextrinase [Clostridiaceae bacterium]
MWYNNSVIYQIYPLGLCDVPRINQPESAADPDSPRINRLLDWLPHLKKMGVNTVLFNPLFESDKHGYDTRDMRKIDRRLGTNEDFKHICTEYRKAGIRLMFDGVFNHVGRGFWAFQDLIKNKQDSQYKDWFFVDFNANSNYNDGFWYAGWEGHFDLVKLNLHNPAVVDYLLNSVTEWIEQYGISGLRLDVAYTVEKNFLKRLRQHCLSINPEFFLIGEMIHGDYKQIMNSEMCHSVTNYECAKGNVSAFNANNLFEIAHSLQRQFNPEPWALYHGENNMVSFVDNHDIERVATVIQKAKNLPLVYTVMFTQPGIPAIYYGSEWGVHGDTGEQDWNLRPAFEKSQWNKLTDFLQKLIEIRKNSHALAFGSYRTVHLNNQQFLFERKTDRERIIVAINMSDQPVTIHFNAGCGQAQELITDTLHDFGGGSTLAPNSAEIWLMEK